MKFEGKTIWITGASSGMGRSVAVLLSKYKTRLIITDRDAAGLEDTALIIRQNGSEAFPEILDMSETIAINSCAEKMLQQFGKIDALAPLWQQKSL